ncbi:hypothetical protein B0T16DRAFT_456196 [Cercophora newfieldiana]|uniref:Protein kinase domain-containing protein n=1 Tax=Cercophora newfieldiana TaxID=92897 RepID=A0AA39Y9W3_9PEZI|nr:hypothetical protein B0T16DRAFT_456196 [Cercophora newfieldiana]
MPLSLCHMKGMFFHRFRRRAGPQARGVKGRTEYPPLSEQLYSDRLQSTFPAGTELFYWSEHRIHTLVNEDLVRWELGKAQGSYSNEIVDFILVHGRKLFAIAAGFDSDRTWLLRAMEFFRKNNIKDSELSAEIGAELRCLERETLTRLDSSLWTFDLAMRICDYQWRALTPVLSTDKANYDFHAKAILPFNIVGTGGMTGAFSIVHKIQIHPDHLKDPCGRFDSDRPDFFAVKQIKPPDAVERERIITSWANEAETLQKMNGEHSNNILRFVTAFTRPDVGSDKSCYLIFEWADSGCLEQLFQENPNPLLTKELVKQAATQLQGLAQALKATHELAQIRHGDVKPDNILRFGATPENIIGTLKIGDWGLAKFHKEATVLRLQNGQQTDTRYGTVMYEPPEVELGEVKLLGRQYDVWSMGCVMLEIIIWLVYGYPSVQQFRVDVKGQYRESVPCYLVEQSRESGMLKGKLQPIVEKWLDYLADEPVCAEDTALGELIRLVRSRLLVVELPPDRGRTLRIEEWEVGESSSEFRMAVRPPTAIGGNLVRSNNLRHRATSTEMANKLDAIMDDEDRPNDYWLRRAELDDVWEFEADPSFAAHTLSSLPKLPKPQAPSRLCQQCRGLDFFGNLVSIKYTMGEMRQRMKKCDLCALLQNTALKNNISPSATETVVFQRDRSWLKMNGNTHPVLSICRGRDSSFRSESVINYGIPELLESGSPAYFLFIRQWLQFCDSSHPGCRASTATQCMPTRVLDVGAIGDAYVSLWEPPSGAKGRYVALSHPWGRGPHFVTDVRNYRQHKDKIPLKDLPATFRDAVLTTRALHVRYLWIDSICIIQGPGGDFDVEAKNMERVFSLAYFVLAASRAYNQFDGFLGPRPRRGHVTLLDRKSPFYICEFIDDFKGDVLDSHLNQRGWVLQEHALARRTVFFANSQTYFECGDGVRCETLTKMSNGLEAFLGDPNFPQIIMSATQGEKIIRLQNLWKRYCTLNFTHDYDRPVAIEGMFASLLAAFKARGSFGVFDEGRDEKTNQPGGLLRRMLLWYRPLGKRPMVSIRFPPGKGAPSWSWMAYIGEIEFLRPKFGNIDWEEVQAPWSGDHAELTGVKDTALRGKVSSITGLGQGLGEGEEGGLFYDISDETWRGVKVQGQVQCVVLGVEKGQEEPGSRIHYFIIVRPAGARAASLDDIELYERVGAGYLPGKYISSSGLEVAIC